MNLEGIDHLLGPASGGHKHHKQEKISIIPDCASHCGTRRRRNDIGENVVFLPFDGKGSCETSNGSLGRRILQENKKAGGLIG